MTNRCLRYFHTTESAEPKNHQANKSVVTTADSVPRSLRSGRFLADVPHFKRAPN